MLGAIVSGSGGVVVPLRMGGRFRALQACQIFSKVDETDGIARTQVI